MIRAVIVDVDDTLCLTEAAAFDLVNDVLARMGRPPVPRTVHLSTWGEALLDAMPRRSPGVDIARFAELFPAAFQEYLAAGRAGIRFVACLQSGVRRLDEFDPRYVTASIDAFPDLVAVVGRGL